MKKIIIGLLAAAAVSAIAAPSMAQNWRGINEEQRELDQKIDNGIRRGCLTRGEAARLRGEFQRIASLERTYRASNGLNNNERRDLWNRLNRLNMDITRQCRDGDNRPGPGPLPLPNLPGWDNLPGRQQRLDNRIDRGVRRGCLSAREAARLRMEWRSIANLQAQYRRGGFTAWERQDLDRRYDRLGADINRQCRDGNNWN